MLIQNRGKGVIFEAQLANHSAKKVVLDYHRYRVERKWSPWMIQLSNEKTLVGWVLWGIILPSYIGIIINHYKDPY